MLKLFLLYFTTSITNPCNLHGKVRIVDNHADYKVYFENVNPDIRVQIVNSFPNKAGKWKIVNAHEDFTIELTNNKSEADFSVFFSDKFPRCNKSKYHFSLDGE